VIPRLPVTRFLFELLRTELRSARLDVDTAVSPRRRRQLQELRQRRDALVNVGCGPFALDGWINLDLQSSDPRVVAWDCRWDLPLADGAAAGIRTEHFLEHLETREELPAFLAACRRVLQPGGVLRVIVPDAERFLRAYCQNGLAGFHELAVPDPFPEDLPTRMDVINHVFQQWHEHRWAYDFETMAHRLKAAGFSRVEKMEYRRSLDDRLAIDRAEHAPYSLYVDAVSM
jgi:predicted SAM-dependent methyltransferase